MTWMEIGVLWWWLTVETLDLKNIRIMDEERLTAMIEGMGVTEHGE